MENLQGNALKEIVKEKYARIAEQSKEENENSCCGAGNSCGSTSDYTIFSDDYSALGGYNKAADLGLGCGLPTEYALIKAGDTVVDLGSGAGNDCFVARSATGETGEVIGIDMTEAMIAKAKANAEKLGYKNVHFRLGDIEDMPLTSNRADIVVSNCVMNLVPNKAKAFQETFRILKPGGHFSISDVVLEGSLPKALTKEAEMYAGCVSGALQKNDYLDIINKAGFQNTKVQNQKTISIPDDILSNYLSEAELKAFKSDAKLGIYSITVYAEKPALDCCAPDLGCC